MLPHRRVVTGLDAEGRSCILLDGASGATGGDEALTTVVLWQSDRAPASNAGGDDAATEPFSFDIPPGGNKFVLVRFAPREELAGPGMHASATLDYGVLLSGQMTLIVETGEVELRPGDTVVDRGIVHAWRNRGPGDAIMLFVNLDAVPVGAGATR